MRQWFASLGAATKSLSLERASASTTAVPAAARSKHCPHPERCHFVGCERDCESPPPAA